MQATLTDNVTVMVIEHRARFVLLGVVTAPPLIVVTDDEITDVAILIWIWAS